MKRNSAKTARRSEAQSSASLSSPEVSPSSPSGLRKIDAKDSARIAGEMLEAAGEMMRRVLEQREEIMTAFVAKYGFDPDECEQIVEGRSWYVVRLAPDRVKRIQREVILARLRRKTFTPWQEFCLWLAGIRK